MIPSQNIVAWSKFAPWAEPKQIEQDLITARAIVLLFSDPFLREELRFRGGTALNKLHFPKPLRYSEDIDLARTKEGASKPLWVRVHDLLDPWLGFDSSVAQPLKTMKTRACVIDFLSCISYTGTYTLEFRARSPSR
jgi:Nucleotidyl transferase AbiEii toxin, Type IV TA system